jgi:hypothetical protein
MHPHPMGGSEGELVTGWPKHAGVRETLCEGVLSSPVSFSGHHCRDLPESELVLDSIVDGRARSVRFHIRSSSSYMVDLTNKVTLDVV